MLAWTDQSCFIFGYRSLSGPVIYLEVFLFIFHCQIQCRNTPVTFMHSFFANLTLLALFAVLHFLLRRLLIFFMVLHNNHLFLLTGTSSLHESNERRVNKKLMTTAMFPVTSDCSFRFCWLCWTLVVVYPSTLIVISCKLHHLDLSCVLVQSLWLFSFTYSSDYSSVPVFSATVKFYFILLSLCLAFGSSLHLITWHVGSLYWLFVFMPPTTSELQISKLWRKKNLCPSYRFCKLPFQI